jgi:small GTP-binding protein
MAYVNLKRNEVMAKIVYYGPGRSGKTTNLEYIHQNFGDHIKTKMISIKTDGDRTLFFDFMPFELGKIMGYDVKVQLYTVPGQVKYDATRKIVLKGVDGVVFVADSMVSRERSNLVSLKNLQDNLMLHSKNIFKIPLVLQYNKRDLSEQGAPLILVERMERTLNAKLKVPSFEASAKDGTNVGNTLKKIMALTVKSLENQLC